jgi:hypothetical protein
MCNLSAERTFHHYNSPPRELMWAVLCIYYYGRQYLKLLLRRRGTSCPRGTCCRAPDTQLDVMLSYGATWRRGPHLIRHAQNRWEIDVVWVGVLSERVSWGLVPRSRLIYSCRSRNDTPHLTCSSHDAQYFRTMYVHIHTHKNSKTHWRTIKASSFTRQAASRIYAQSDIL